MINFDKINEIYGIKILILIKENLDDINKNINYLHKLEFDDVQDIFERNTPIFICSFEEFKKKIDTLINKLGVEYVDILENNMQLWEELVW